MTYKLKHGEYKCMTGSMASVPAVPHKALLPNALKLPAARDGFFFGHKPTPRFGMVALGFCHTK
jgi:hypothetical protein